MNVSDSRFSIARKTLSRRLTAVGLLFCFGPITHASTDMVAVAVSGWSAPQTGATYAHFQSPRINLNGDIVFKAALNEGDPGVTSENREGVWLAQENGEVRLVTRQGREVPYYSHSFGVPNLRLDPLREVHHPVIDAAGNVSFRGRIDIAGDPLGIWITSDSFRQGDVSPAALWLVALEDEDAQTTVDGVLPPVIDRSQFAALGDPVLNPDGTLTFTGTLSGGNWDGAVGAWYFTRPGGVEYDPTPGRAFAVAISGDPAPGTSGDIFAAIGQPHAGFGNQTVFHATLATGDNDPIPIYHPTGIWLGPPAGLTPLAQTGEAAPQTPGGGQFFVLGKPSINSSSQVAYWGGVSEEDMTEGIWLRKFGQALPVALNGGSAPGMNDGTSFSYFF